MPTATDLVTDLPADFEVFGQAVATSMADLLGGTTGQILSKTSNTDMDFTWTTPNPGDITGVTAGVGISGGGTSGDVTITNSMATAMTTSGDLIQATGSGTFARLATGTSGQYLTTNGTTNSWVTPTGGAYTLLSTTSLSGASQTISGISQSYKHLYCVYYGLSSASNWNTTCAPNGVGADWWQGGLNGNSAFENNATAFNIFGSAVQGANAANNGAFTIFNYSSTVANKSVVGSARYFAVSLGGQRGSTWGGASATAGAISSLVLTTGGGLTAGTFLIYGVN